MVNVFFIRLSWLVLSLWLLAFGGLRNAKAQQSIPQIRQEINIYFPSNTTRAINASRLRETLNDILDNVATTNVGMGKLVDDFGAIGNGVADDYTALQNALNAGYSHLRFRDGATYKITNELIVPSGVTLDMRGGTVRQMTPDKNAFVVSAPNGASIINGTVEAGYVIAPGDAYVYEKNNGFYINNSRFVTIKNCKIRKWGSCGIQINKTYYYTISDNVFTQNYIVNNSSAHGDIVEVSSYPESTSGYKGGYGLIENNFCLSNTRIGIYANLNGGARYMRVSGNVVIPCDSVGNPLSNANVKTLHGIASSYVLADGEGQVDISHNHIRNTLNTGIYAPNGNADSTSAERISIISNMIYNVGHGNASGISGGICIGRHSSAIIQANTISGYMNTTYGAAIVAHTGVGVDSTFRYLTKIIDNVLHDSRLNGIETTGDNILISGNSITNSRRFDIYVSNIVNPSVRNFVHKNIEISSNSIIRTIASVWSKIHVEWGDGAPKAEVSPILIVNNKIVDYYGKQSVGIQITRGQVPRIIGNYIFKANIAIYLNKNINGLIQRNRNIVDNYIYDATDGFSYQGTISDASSIYVIGEQRFENVTYKIRNQTSGVNECAVIASHVKEDGDISFSASSTPSYGTYQVGDRLELLTPSAGGYTGKICTTAGVAGTAVWKDYGTIQP